MIGKNEWLIPDGFMNPTKNGDFESHEAVCVLNLNDRTAHIQLTVYFEDADPLTGFTAECTPNRTHHIRLDWLRTPDGRAIPHGVPYAVRVQSDVPIVAQHSRMDVSQPAMTLMTTIPYSG